MFFFLYMYTKQFVEPNYSDIKAYMDLFELLQARESVKIEHEKKLSTLQSLEYRGRDSAKLDKTKASINKLQSLIVVTSQAATTTSSAIVRVRDNELAPQLVELCFA